MSGDRLRKTRTYRDKYFVIKSNTMFMCIPINLMYKIHIQANFGQFPTTTLKNNIVIFRYCVDNHKTRGRKNMQISVRCQSSICCIFYEIKKSSFDNYFLILSHTFLSPD